MKLKSFLLLLVFLPLVGCKDGAKGNYVTAYTAHDQIYSEPVFQLFTEKTGIEVRAVYDTEAVKTAGLVARLMAEEKSPQCDVFWNNEIIRTIALKKKGMLQRYQSPEAAMYPPEYRDSDGFWTGFAGRARVFIYNKNLIKDTSELPNSIFALKDPAWKGKTAIGKPLFGTTATHAAFLFAKMSSSDAKQFLLDMKKNEVIVTAGNAMVRDMVAHGRVPLGLTDTDDVNGAIEDGFPVDMIYPDSDADKTLVIPNTVSLIKGAPHPENGKRLIDFLLSRETEEFLNRNRAAQIPLRTDATSNARIPALKDIPYEHVDWEKVADALDESAEFIQKEF
jgi:iron(III) transport system substrate-binding protein